jgi:hypothetical protein
VIQEPCIPLPNDSGLLQVTAAKNQAKMQPFTLFSTVHTSCVLQIVLACRQPSYSWTTKKGIPTFNFTSTLPMFHQSTLSSFSPHTPKPSPLHAMQPSFKSPCPYQLNIGYVSAVPMQPKKKQNNQPCLPPSRSHKPHHRKLDLPGHSK